MSKSINDNFRVSAGKPIDAKYLNQSNAPYTGTTQVFSQIPLSERFLGLTVNVNNIEYWFKTGVTTTNSLIQKSLGAANGLSINGTNVVLGGPLTSGITTNITFPLPGVGDTGVEFKTATGSGNRFRMLVDTSNVARFSTLSSDGSSFREVFVGSSSSNGMGLYQSEISNQQYAYVEALSNRVDLTSRRQTGPLFGRLRLDTNKLTLTATGAGIFAGYAADYASGFTKFSWVDKNFVTGLTTTLPTTANNGLTKSGFNIRLGGQLTGTTTIGGQTKSYGLKLGNSGSNELNHLEVKAGYIDLTTSSSGITFTSGTVLNGTSTTSITFNAGTTASLIAATQISIDAGAASSRLLLNTTNAEFLDKRAIKRGIEYASANYATGFTSLSLVHKQWVLDQVVGATGSTFVLATNGLTKSGSYVRLGGTLTGSTLVDANNNSLIIKLSTRKATATFIKGDIGATANVSMFTIKVNTGTTVAQGLTDLIIGPHTGSTLVNGTTAGNISIGSRNLNSLKANVSEFDGGRNVTIGYENQFASTGGTHYVFIGRNIQRNATFQSLATNGYSVGLGYEIFKNTTRLGGWNIGIGSNIGVNAISPVANTSGLSYNILMGDFVAYAATLSTSNIIMGRWAARNYTGGSNTIILGNYAALSAKMTTSSDGNIIIGSSAGQNISSTTTMTNNLFVGTLAASTARGGTYSVALGPDAFTNGKGSFASAVGRFAGNRFVGDYNSAFGAYAGYQSIDLTGTTNTFIGYLSTYSASTLTNTIVLGNFINATQSNKIYLGGSTQATILGKANNNSTATEVVVKNTSGELETRTVQSLNQMGVRVITNNSTTTSTDQLVLVTTASSGLTVTLRTSPLEGECIIIKDRSGNANAKNININGGGKNIDGSATAIINTNYGAAQLVYSLTADAWFSIGMIT